jgi:glycosyltransferase 2 family protein
MPPSLLHYGKTIFSIAKRSWLVVFIVVCSVLITRYLDSLVDHFNHKIDFDAKFFALTIVLQMAFWLLLSITWRNIAQRITHARIPLLISFSHMALLGLGKYLPGKIWGAVARGSRMSQQGISTAKTTVATYLEQVLLVHAGLVLTGILTAVVFQTPAAWSIGLLSILSVIIVARYHNLLLTRLLGKLSKFGYFKSVADVPVTSFPYTRYLAAYGVIWLLAGFVFAGLFAAFLQREVLSFELLLALVLASTAGIIAGFLALFAPGGIGVREAVSIAALTPFMTLSDAVAITILSRIWLVATDLISGGVGLVILHREKTSRF